MHPLGLVLKAGVWYLIATHNGEPRTYRVSRIVEAELLADRIVRPEGFDLGRHWDESSSQFQQSLLRYDVVARVRVTALGYLQRIVDPASWDRIAKQLAERESTGDWATITIGTEMFGQAFGILLRLAGDAEVLEPGELRERLAETARSMAERYQVRTRWSEPSSDASRAGASETEERSSPTVTPGCSGTSFTASTTPGMKLDRS